MYLDAARHDGCTALRSAAVVSAMPGEAHLGRRAGARTIEAAYETCAP